MKEKHQKTEKVRVDNITDSIKYYVVSNVVCKKLVKNHEKPLKTGKVRVRINEKPMVFGYFWSKSENISKNNKREHYKNTSFGPKVRIDKKRGSEIYVFYEKNQFLEKM